MGYTLFSGCSYPAGAGFLLTKGEPSLWVNQLYNNFFSHTAKLNVALSGRTNAGIFQDTVKHMLSHPVKYAVVAWTNVPRYELELGFELSPTRVCMIPGSIIGPYHLHNMEFSSAYLESIRDRFTTLAHDIYEIANLVDYTRIIKDLAQVTNTRVFFVNSMGPWDDNFFVKKTNVLPSEYTPYTQDLLLASERDDNEVFKLYDKMHDRLVGIDPQDWLNLYGSLENTRVDVNDDGSHPGFISNAMYSNRLSLSLSERL